MKRINIIIIAIFCVGILSCNDLNLEPKGQYGQAEFYGSPSGVSFVFTTLYGWLPIEDFHYMRNNGYRDNNTDPWGRWEAPKQSLQNNSGEFVNTNVRANTDGTEYWPYERIREINTFIINFPTYKDNFTEAVFNELLGEARFLRAFYYSGLAKRYGGVPIIAELQDPRGDLAELQVPRNTEYDVWKFIYEDLKFAGENMTSKPDIYRGTRWAALALQSRLMLYAATNAKYDAAMNYAGEEAYDKGFAGIPANKAAEFFKYSYDASKELIEKGPYELYRVHDDLAYNFAQAFMDKNSKENIFVKSYVHHDVFNRDAMLIGHNWDALMLPSPSISSFVGGQGYPSLNQMRKYEGFPDLVAADGTPRRFNKPGDIREEGIEPRMRGCIYLNGDVPRAGDEVPVAIDTRRGIYRTFRWQASDVIHGANEEAPNTSDNRIVSNDLNATIEKTDGTRISLIGAHGLRSGSGGENNCLSGGFVRKYINETMAKADCKEHMSFQPWIVFRLGEVYLNHAEAAYEMGLKEEANTYIRKIRERAGCKKLDISGDPADVDEWELTKSRAIYGSGITYDVELQFIRDERDRELWGENHRWWDVRRWRNAYGVLYQFQHRILSCYYILDEDKYIYLDERNKDNHYYDFNRNGYYQSIPQGQINRNPNLLPKNPLR